MCELGLQQRYSRGTAQRNGRVEMCERYTLLSYRGMKLRHVVQCVSTDILVVGDDEDDVGFRWVDGGSVSGKNETGREDGKKAADGLPKMARGECHNGRCLEEGRRQKEERHSRRHRQVFIADSIEDTMLSNPSILVIHTRLNEFCAQWPTAMFSRHECTSSSRR